MIDEITASEWEWHRTSVLLKDGSWIHDTKDRRADLHSSEHLFHEELHPYANVTKDGKIQSCIATIQVWEREWRWNGISKISKDIEIQFSEELGSEAGSWKGGAIGCLYEMFEGEIPLQTLKRMERDKKFK